MIFYSKMVAARFHTVCLIFATEWAVEPPVCKITPRALNFFVMENDDPKALAAQSWFGYGKWNAPYWFVGMEPGGTDDHATYETWAQLGGTELIDCREHHLASANAEWHGPDRPRLQPTWGRLIRLVLGYEGKPTDLDAVKNYQRSKWGTLTGETASLVLSALHAPHIGADVNRNLYREQRIAVLRERLKEYTPKFVVFYGTSYKDDYAKIAETSLTPNGFVWRGSMLCALVQHPTARPARSGEYRSEEWWAEKGRVIRTILEKAILPTPVQAPSIRTTAFYSPSDVVRLLVDGNPKTGKSRHRFDCYRDGMTPGDYEKAVRQRHGEFEARKCKPDLKWDIAHGFIRIERG